MPRQKPTVVCTRLPFKMERQRIWVPFIRKKRKKNLQWFSATTNHFSGSFPRSFKDCSSLIILDIMANHMDGDISGELGVYPNLEFVGLTSNKLHGHLLPNWGSCHKLI
jgi:hypothetical protein